MIAGGIAACMAARLYRERINSGSPAALRGDAQVVESELGEQARMAEQIALHLIDTGAT